MDGRKCWWMDESVKGWMVSGRWMNGGWMGGWWRGWLGFVGGW